MNELTRAPDNDAPPIKPLGMGVFLAVGLGLPLWYTWSMYKSGIVIDQEAMQENPEAVMAIMVPLMVFGGIQALGPGIAALLARLMGKEGFGEGNFRWMPGKLFWKLLLGYPLLAWLAFAITALTGMGTINSEALSGLGGKEVAGLAATLLLTPLVTLLFAIPSEWGWRAYFYSRMAGRFGPKTGALWAAVPAAALGAVAVKVAIPQGGISEMQAMVAAVVNAAIFSVLASYFYRRWRSIWASALLPVAIGVHAATLARFIINPEPWIGAPQGAIFFAVVGVLAWRLWQADWTPIDESTKLLEPEMAYEIPDTPAIPPPMTAGAPEKPEEAAGDESPGDWT